MHVQISPTTLRFLPNVPTDGLIHLFPGLDAGHSAITLVWRRPGRVRWVFKRIAAGFAQLLSRGEEAGHSGKGRDDDSPKPITDVAKNKVVRNESKKRGQRAPPRNCTIYSHT